VVLRPESEIESLDLDLHLGSTAVDLNLRERRLLLHGGRELRYDALVIATGARPRTLPGVSTGLAGVHTFRTVDDARAVRAGLDAGARVVVVGGGFIGAEVAASARARGVDVTIVEALPVPLGRVLGEQMGSACAALHRDHGVDLRCSVAITGIEGHGRVERVRLSDGSEVDADLVVVGVGAAPATDWLRASGLELDDGVVCDPYCAASASGVFAAGDVARWEHRDLGERIRVEHWTNAVEQGTAVARNLLAGPQAAAPFTPIPYFWSDQYETRIQFVGRRHPDGQCHIVHGSIEERRFVAVYGHGQRLAAVLGFGLPREFLAYRRLLARGASWAEALRCARQVA
jgi:NADPH-dependent 2,4-dienoyl-CoA reductase/sulfur reductase-like enzyme